MPAPQSRRMDAAAHSIMIADSPRRDEGFAEPVPRKVRSGPSPSSSAGGRGNQPLSSRRFRVDVPFTFFDVQPRRDVAPQHTRTIVTGRRPPGAEERGPLSRQRVCPREAALTAVACVVHNYPIDDLRVAGFRVQHDVRVSMNASALTASVFTAHFDNERLIISRHADEVVFIPFLDANIRSPGARRS